VALVIPDCIFSPVWFAAWVALAVAASTDGVEVTVIVVVISRTRLMAPRMPFSVFRHYS
jgi:hypothetical protein